ncbi:MAG TPA: hypothetical protein VGI75_09855, partial [Pirellulales bacterium]
PKIRQIQIENVTVESATNAGRILGLADSPIEEIAFKNTKIAADNAMTLENASSIQWDGCEMSIKNPQANSVRGADFQR